MTDKAELSGQLLRNIKRLMDCIGSVDLDALMIEASKFHRTYRRDVELFIKLKHNGQSEVFLGYDREGRAVSAKTAEEFVNYIVGSLDD